MARLNYGPLDTWRWGHYDRSKRRELSAQQHRVTSQEDLKRELHRRRNLPFAESGTALTYMQSTGQLKTQWINAN